MKFIKNSSILMVILLILLYLSVFIILPSLLPKPLAISGPVGLALWLSGQSQETRQLTFSIALIFLFTLSALLIIYIANFLVRSKMHKWDRWFLLITLLFLPVLPFSLVATITILRMLTQLIK